MQPPFLANLDLARAHVTERGAFLVAKSTAKNKPLYRKGKWYTVHTASGTLISSQDGDDTKRDATEYADLLEHATTADGNPINWAQFSTSDELRYTQTIPGYAYDEIHNKTELRFQAQRAAADDAALEAQRPADHDPHTGPFRRRDDLLAYWAQGADPALPENHRNALRNIATQNPETVHLSADGQFALISATLGWLVLTARSGNSLIPASDPNHQARTNHPTRKAAEGWATHVATLRDADGNPLNWAAPDIRPDDRGSDRGESWKLAFLRIDAEHAAQFGDQHRNAERRYNLERERTDNNGAGTGRIWGREIQDGTALQHEADPTLPERVLSITHRTDDQITLLTTAGPRTVGTDERVALATGEPQRSAVNDEGQTLGTRALPFELEAGQRVQLQTPASTLYGRALLSETLGASHPITLWATVTSVSPERGEIRLDGVRLWDGSGRPLARTDHSTIGLRQYDNNGRPLVQTSDSITFTLSELIGLGPFVQLDEDAPEPRDKYAQELVPRPETPEPHEISPKQMQPGDHVTFTVGGRLSLEWPDSTRGLATTPEEVKVQGLVSPSYDSLWSGAALLQATLTDAATGEVLAADEPHVLIRRLPTSVVVDPSKNRDDLRPEPRRADQVRVGDLIARGRTGLAVMDIFHVTNRTPHIGFRFGDDEYPFLPEAGEELAVVPRERRRLEDLARLLGPHRSLSAMQLDMDRIAGPNSLLARLKEDAERRSEIVPGLSAALDEVDQALAPLQTAGTGAEGCRERATALRAALPLAQQINAELPLSVRTQSGVGEDILNLCTTLDVQAERLDADVASLERRAAERAAAKARETTEATEAQQTAPRPRPRPRPAKPKPNSQCPSQGTKTHSSQSKRSPPQRGDAVSRKISRTNRLNQPMEKATRPRRPQQSKSVRLNRPLPATMPRQGRPSGAAETHRHAKRQTLRRFSVLPPPKAQTEAPQYPLHPSLPCLPMSSRTPADSTPGTPTGDAPQENRETNLMGPGSLETAATHRSRSPPPRRRRPPKSWTKTSSSRRTPGPSRHPTGRRNRQGRRPPTAPALPRHPRQQPKVKHRPPSMSPRGRRSAA